MVKNIVSHKYPQRIIKFKKMVTEARSKTTHKKDPYRIFLAKYSPDDNESPLWLSGDTERWEKFQEDFQEEFEDKMDLMKKIRGKKKQNEVFYLLEEGYFI